MNDTTPATYTPLAGIGPRRVARYAVIAVRSDMPDPQFIVSDFWMDWVEELYVTRRRYVHQVFCTLGRDYQFGTAKEE